jgi:hypothetical protein
VRQEALRRREDITVAAHRNRQVSSDAAVGVDGQKRDATRLAGKAVRVDVDARRW